MVSRAIAGRRLNVWAASNETMVSDCKAYGKSALQNLLTSILTEQGEVARHASLRVGALLNRATRLAIVLMHVCIQDCTAVFH